MKKLKFFYHMAKEASVTKAALKLNIMQPAVNRSLGYLEHRMEDQLFERNTTPFKLTHEGETVFKFAEKIIQETESFLKILHEENDDLKGELKIITTPYGQ